MKKKLKLYLHHGHFEPVTYSKRTGLFGVILDILLTFFYAIGLGVLFVIKLPYLVIKFIVKLPSEFHKVVRNIKQPSYQKTLAIFVLMALISLTAVHGLVAISLGQTIKGQVLGASTSGIGFLENAKISLDSQNPAAAQADLTKALDSFKESEKSLNSSNIVLKGLLSVVPQKQDADKLISAAELITQAGINATELIQITDNLKLSAVGLSGDGNNKENLEKTRRLLNETVDLATRAGDLINKVSVTSLPEKYRSAFVAVKDSSSLFLNNASTLKEVSSLAFDIILGNKNVLIVFQNNNELRASGGFMGTIGNAKLSDGALNSLDVRSVYDWDGQLKEKVMPPQPIYAVNDRWYLRDSNWFANFPDSAVKISSFFEKEGGETPDIIIAMTPEVIIDMLKVTGPIELTQHKVTLTAENFVEKTQTETSVNYDKTQNQPKQFLADFFPLLMQQLGSNENGGMISFLSIFQKNLQEKQIVMFSRNADIQQQISKFNWGGELKSTDRDYLSVVSSNLGGTKTDRSIQRDINLKSTIHSDGTISNTLSLTVSNPLPNQEGLNNKSFIRVYVPQGSTLSNSSGFDTDIQLPRLSAPDYVLDTKVQNWQSGVTQDTVSGTYTGTEAGKTWFGNWLNIKGGETKTVTLNYTLPFKLSGLDRHSILLQKQPGSINQKFNYDLDLGSRSKLWSSSNTSFSNNILHYNDSLLTDKFIGVVTE